MSSSLFRNVVDPFSRSTTLQSKSPAASSGSPRSTKNAQMLKNLKTSVTKSVEGLHATWITQLGDLYKSSFMAALSQLDTSEKSLKSVRTTILDPLMKHVIGIDSSGTIFQLGHSSAPKLPITGAEGSVDFIVFFLNTRTLSANFNIRLKFILITIFLLIFMLR